MSLKICVIGCGGHGSAVHGPSYERYARETPDTELSACCDLDGARAEAFRQRFGFKRAYTDMDEMLRKERPDAVCVLVPPQAICETALRVMKKGFAVQMEKPPGLCRAETEQLIAAARETGVINQVAFNRRFMPLMRALRERLAGQQGVQNLFYEMYRVNRREPTFETTAIHGIDAASFLMGRAYREVFLTYQPLPGMGEGVVNILMECRFGDGAMGTLHFCPCTGAVLERITVTAAGHTFFLRTPIWNGCDAPGELKHLQGGCEVERLDGSALSPDQSMYVTNGFYAENCAFFDAVRQGRPCGQDVASTLQSVILEEAIRNRMTHCVL